MSARKRDGDSLHLRAREDKRFKTMDAEYMRLCVAAGSGNCAKVQRLLDRGVDVEGWGGSATPLFHASLCGHLDVVSLLIDRGANVDTVSVFGTTPLHVASREGQLEVVRLLLEVGAKIDCVDNGRNTPLHLASRDDRLFVVQLLLEHGANIEATNDHLRTSLHEAAASRVSNLNTIQLLVGRGANRNARDIHGKTPLDIARERGICQQTVEFLQQYEDREAKTTDDGGDDVESQEETQEQATVVEPNNGTSNGGFTTWPDAIFDDAHEDPSLKLHFAVKYSNERRLKGYLESVGDNDSLFNQTDSVGRTAMDLAALTGQTNLVQILEEKGATYQILNESLMDLKAKKRSKNVDKYKQAIYDSVE